MPSRCIFFLSALRAWSTLLSRTRTCTKHPLTVGQSGIWGLLATGKMASTQRQARGCIRSNLKCPHATGVADGFLQALIACHHSDVPHLAARPRRLLAVE